MQLIHQGGEYILNGPSPLSFSTGGEPWGPFYKVYTVVDVPHLLLGYAVAYQFHDRLVHPRIRFIYAALVASAEHAFCLFPPSFCGMKEHLVQYYQLVGSSKTPLGVYSSRKNSRSTHLSDSQTEIPASLALS